MDATARNALTSALDAATTGLGQAHADTSRAIEAFRAGDPFVESV